MGEIIDFDFFDCTVYKLYLSKDVKNSQERKAKKFSQPDINV